MSDPAELRISFKGEKANSAAAVAEMLTAVDNLFRAVSKETVGHEIGLNLAAFKWSCDGCGLEVDRIPDTWIKRGADDLCEVCAKGAQA